METSKYVTPTVRGRTAALYSTSFLSNRSNIPNSSMNVPSNSNNSTINSNYTSSTRGYRDYSQNSSIDRYKLKYGIVDKHNTNSYSSQPNSSTPSTDNISQTDNSINSNIYTISNDSNIAHNSNILDSSSQPIHQTDNNSSYLDRYKPRYRSASILGSLPHVSIGMVSTQTNSNAAPTVQVSYISSSTRHPSLNQNSASILQSLSATPVQGITGSVGQPLTLGTQHIDSDRYKASNDTNVSITNTQTSEPSSILNSYLSSKNRTDKSSTNTNISSGTYSRYSSHYNYNRYGQNTSQNGQSTVDLSQLNQLNTETKTNNSSNSISSSILSTSFDSQTFSASTSQNSVTSHISNTANSNIKEIGDKNGSSMDNYFSNNSPRSNIPHGISLDPTYFNTPSSLFSLNISTSTISSIGSLSTSDTSSHLSSLQSHISTTTATTIATTIATTTASVTATTITTGSYTAPYTTPYSSSYITSYSSSYITSYSSSYTTPITKVLPPTTTTPDSTISSYISAASIPSSVKSDPSPTPPYDDSFSSFLQRYRSRYETKPTGNSSSIKRNIEPQPTTTTTETNIPYLENISNRYDFTIRNTINNSTSLDNKNTGDVSSSNRGNNCINLSTTESTKINNNINNNNTNNDNNTNTPTEIGNRRTEGFGHPTQSSYLPFLSARDLSSNITPVKQETHESIIPSYIHRHEPAISNRNDGITSRVIQSDSNITKVTEIGPSTITGTTLNNIFVSKIVSTDIGSIEKPTSHLHYIPTTTNSSTSHIANNPLSSSDNITDINQNSTSEKDNSTSFNKDSGQDNIDTTEYHHSSQQKIAAPKPKKSDASEIVIQLNTKSKYKPVIQQNNIKFKPSKLSHQSDVQNEHENESFKGAKTESHMNDTYDSTQGHNLQQNNNNNRMTDYSEIQVDNTVIDKEVLTSKSIKEGINVSRDQQNNIDDNSATISFSSNVNNKKSSHTLSNKDKQYSFNKRTSAVRKLDELPRSGSGRVINPSSDWLVDSLSNYGDSQLQGIYEKTMTRKAINNNRQRSNSSNSVYVRDSLANPDIEQLWTCIGILIKNLMDLAGKSPGNPAPKFNVFNQMYPDPAPQTKKIPIPSTSLDEILTFLKKLSSKAQLEAGCVVISYVYFERFLIKTRGSFPLRWYNWTCLMILSIMLASKVWDDLSMWNIDYTKICPFLTIKRINMLESTYLMATEFGVWISQRDYAQYFFKIRSMLGVSTLPTDDEYIPATKKSDDKQTPQLEEKKRTSRSKSSISSRYPKQKSPKASLEELINFP